MQITKSYLEDMRDKGFSSQQMREQIKKDFNKTITNAQLKSFLKLAKIDMRKKPKFTGFEFVDDVAETQDTQSEGVVSSLIREGYTLSTGDASFTTPGLSTVTDEDEGMPTSDTAPWL